MQKARFEFIISSVHKSKVTHIYYFWTLKEIPTAQMPLFQLFASLLFLLRFSLNNEEKKLSFNRNENKKQSDTTKKSTFNFTFALFLKQRKK